MEERRKNKRTRMEASLLVKRLDDNSVSEVALDITDVSKTGVGFYCSEALSIGAIYEAHMTIWTKEVLHAFLQIVRIELKDAAFFYGATFVGMSEMDASRIEVYQTVNES